MPDAAETIRAFVVPEIAPPYDDAGEMGAAGVQCALPGTGVALPGPDPANPAATAAATWPAQFAQVLSETLAGYRPPGQLAPWTTEQARKRISQLGPMLAPRGAHSTPRGPRVRRVIVSSPAKDVLEMTVIVDVGGRARAVAVRLERPSPSHDAQATAPAGAHRQRQAGWLCTAVEAA